MPITIKKRDPKSSQQELITEINHFAILLDEEGETDAALDLRQAALDLSKHGPESKEYFQALELVQECFSGDHELNAYTFHKPAATGSGTWTKADDLFLRSTTVLNLCKRLVRR